MVKERQLSKDSTRIFRGLVAHLEEQEVRRETTRAVLHTATATAPETAGNRKPSPAEREVEGGTGR